jgi:colanic acid/amylovoran biosynthesis glycosyltransferase
VRVAYLVSRYPAVSHAFIEREVAALRRAGVEVDTYSVNAPGPYDLLSTTARADAAATPVLLEDRRALATGAMSFAVTHPVVLLRALAAALRRGAPGARGRLWQVFYLVEAVHLLHLLRARGTRHLHVHLANNGADIARSVVSLGRLLDGPGSGWAWSLSMHGPTEFDDPVGFDLAAKVRDASFVACISVWCRDALLALAPEVGHALHLVRMTVDVERYPPRADQRADRAGEDVVVLFVGRLVPEKAPDALVEAVRRLRADDRRVRLGLVGAGPLHDALVHQVAAQGLQASVDLCGARGQDELPGLYAAADVFCLPSRSEGLPVVLMEALSSELPVLATRITGIPELVVDDETGLLVAPDDVPALTEALRRLVDDAALRARLGRAGRRRVLEEFVPDPNAARLVTLLRSAQRLP